MLQKIKYFLKYFLAAGTRYDIHSPLLASLMQHLFKPLPGELARNITHYKKILYIENQYISNIDMGAGSTSGQNPAKIPVRHILNNAVSGRFKLGLLYQISKWFKPVQILELGTSLGFSAVTLHLSSGSFVTTIEGNPHIAELAAKTFEHFGYQQHISLLQGPFDEHLDQLFNQEKFDLYYIDGNHTYDATLTYWHQIMQRRTGKRTLVIFDDIYWSGGMQKAWHEIIASPKAHYSVDCYVIGFVLHDPDISTSQHKVLAPQYLKPWRLGFFPHQ